MWTFDPKIENDFNLLDVNDMLKRLHENEIGEQRMVEVLAKEVKETRDVFTEFLKYNFSDALYRRVNSIIDE